MKESRNTADGFAISNTTNSPNWMDFSHCLQMKQGAKLTFLSTGQKAGQSLNLTSHTI